MYDKFIDNKYKQWYVRLITTRQMQQPNKVLTEEHHIIPKSLGGADSKDNLVVLTLREHFIAHLLLSKITSGSDAIKMAQALSFMSNDNSKTKRKFNSKKYELAKSLVRKIYYAAGQTYHAETALQSKVLSEFTDLEKVYTRGLCKSCKIEPRAINYVKNSRTYYRSKCESCLSGKINLQTPRWVFEGYTKLSHCEVCGFKAKFSEQLIVMSNGQNYKTSCLNCQIAIRLTPPTPKPDI